MIVYAMEGTETMHSATLRQLKVLEAAARRLRYSRATEELYLTRPVESIQVKQLAAKKGIRCGRLNIAVISAGDYVRSRTTASPPSSSMRAPKRALRSAILASASCSFLIVHNTVSLRSLCRTN